MKTIKQWWNERKAQARDRELESIRRSFNVVEKGGKLYLTHQGYAFAAMQSCDSAEIIAARLEDARYAAIEFEEK